MKHVKTAVRLESLGLPFRKALDEAARMGAAGIRFDAAGDLSPNQLSDSGRRELKNLLRVRGLELAALGCPLRRSLDDAEGQQPRLEYVREAMTLAFELGPRLVVLPAGPLPAKEDVARSALMHEALTDLSRHGDHVGTRVALETGSESGETLAACLAAHEGGTLGADLDPGGLLRNGFKPLAAIPPLAGRILHVTARDGRRGRETALGAGDIDWLALLEALEGSEYRGWLTVTRDEGDRRLQDVEAGLAFLKRLLA